MAEFKVGDRVQRRLTKEKGRVKEIHRDSTPKTPPSVRYSVLWDDGHLEGQIDPGQLEAEE